MCVRVCYVHVHVNVNWILKSSIQHKKDSFHQQTGLKFKDEACDVLRLEHTFVWRWNMDTSESRSEIPGKIWNVVMEKISWTDHARNEEVLHRVNEERNIKHTVQRRKANWIGYILRGNCLLDTLLKER